MGTRRAGGMKRWFLENEDIEGRQALSDYFPGLRKGINQCLHAPCLRKQNKEVVSKLIFPKQEPGQGQWREVCVCQSRAKKKKD